MYLSQHLVTISHLMPPRHEAISMLYREDMHVCFISIMYLTFSTADFQNYCDIFAVYHKIK